MNMRQYRVIGSATYLDRTGAVRRINVNRCVEAPDAPTAAVLMLGEIDIHAGADADYDPQARWEVGQPPTVEDETAKQEAIAASGLIAGMEVLHKSGTDARRGVVRRLYTITKRGKPAVKASVDWPAPNRISGDGWHRSDVLTSALIPATDMEVERRRTANREKMARWNARLERASVAREMA